MSPDEFDKLTNDLEACLKLFLKYPRPGKVLEIPHFGELKHLPCRRVSYTDYSAGLEQIYQLQDSTRTEAGSYKLVAEQKA